MLPHRILKGEELPTLAIPGTRVVDGRLVTGIGFTWPLYVLLVQHVPQLKTCPKCYAYKSLVLSGQVRQKLTDTPMHGMHVRLHVERQRYRCKVCTATSLERLDWIHDERQATRRLVGAIEKDCLAMSQIQTAHKYGVDDKTVASIQEKLIERLEWDTPLKTPEWLGIDEIHISKKFHAVFTDVEKEILVEMLETRSKAAIIAFLHTLDRQKVRVVVIDMWRQYRDAAREVLPHATVVVDKFHVLRLANEALEKVRKEYGKALGTAEGKKLKGNRFVLLKRRKKLTDEEVANIETRRERSPELIAAYVLKERFFGIYDAHTASEARDRYARWLKTVPEPLKAAGGPWYELVRAMDHWEPEIMAYFEHRVTNAYTESMNRVIRDISRDGNGHSFRVLRAKAVFGQAFRKKGKLASQAKRARRAFEEESWESGLLWTLSKQPFFRGLNGEREIESSE